MNDPMLATQVADDRTATGGAATATAPGPGPADGVAAARFPDLGAGVGTGPMAPMDVLSDVDVTVTVELGRVRMRVRDLLSLTAGSVVELDRTAGAPVDVLVNGTRVARGEVVVVGDELGVRVTEMLRTR